MTGFIGDGLKAQGRWKKESSIGLMVIITDEEHKHMSVLNTRADYSPYAINCGVGL